MSTASGLTVDDALYKIGDEVKATFLGIEHTGKITKIFVGEDMRTNTAGIYYEIYATEPKPFAGGFIVHEDNVKLVSPPSAEAMKNGGKRKSRRRRAKSQRTRGRRVR